MKVFCYGCFDLFHKGHLCFLQEASSHGAELLVGVLPDSFIKETKGESRPIKNQNERLKTVKDLNFVSGAKILQKTKTLLPTLTGKELKGAQMIFDVLLEQKIDVLFLPSVYKISNQFKELMAKHNIKIVIAKNFVDNISTTKIIENYFLR